MSDEPKLCEDEGCPNHGTPHVCITIPPAYKASPVAVFKYLNHNRKMAVRTVSVDAVEYVGKPGFGYAPGWFVSGWCHDKCARRSFALSNIVLPTGDEFKFYKLLVL